jgi:hypothetical protein
MRGDVYVAESKKELKKDLNVRDMLKITRKLNEQDEQTGNVQNKKTIYDQKAEEDKFKNFVRDLNINVKFDELKVFDNLVFWGGIIDGIIVFTFSVTPDERTSKVTFDYLPDFSPDNPENDEIIKRVESYYDTFYEYWKDNIVQQ